MLCSPQEAAALLRPVDRLDLPLGPGQPAAFLEALGERDDWRDLDVFTGLLSGLYPLFTRPGVRLRSGFFGPAERILRDQGHAVAFVPADFRRFQLIAERRAARVVATAATPPDAHGWMSLSLHAGAAVREIDRCARDPERLLVVETNPQLPRTLGLGSGQPHAIHVDAADVIIASDRPPLTLPEVEPSEVETAISRRVEPYVRDGTTLQTGIGGIPSAVVRLLAEAPGGDYGIHSEMFTTGLMHLHRAGKVSNAHKGIYVGHSVATFALGSPELYEWLDGGDVVRFLPVDMVNSPEVIARHRNMLSINGALLLDLAGQIVADTIDGRQHSGIGGHEDFTSGAGLEADDRSLICLPSTATVGGRTVSRIVSQLGAGAIVTTPRHQLDVVITEYGAAEVAGASVPERARALAAIAHPDFRDELMAAAQALR